MALCLLQPDAVEVSVLPTGEPLDELRRAGFLVLEGMQGRRAFLWRLAEGEEGA